MTMKKRKIFLADLTHTGQSVASNVFPLAIGLIANYFLNKQKSHYDVELFKYPQDLSSRLESEIPDVIGFSNYSWNCEISYKFTQYVKQHKPETVIVWGGPNYGLTDGEVRQFWKNYSNIDFYLIKEGEIAFSELISKLEEFQFDVKKLKDSGVIPVNAHFIDSNQNIVQGNVLDRIKDLSIIGSPYLSGLMDKFFDQVLIPMVHTTRGCPFSCTFCSEGNSYYNKVAQTSLFREELEYIAMRRGNIQDLLITDANFGMFPQDLVKADLIAEIREQFGWPSKILVSTGKNKKERVISVAKKLGGALSITASLQSTNEEILKSIKRSNISVDALQIIVNESNEANTSTYTELIVGLPGDSVEAHVQSLRDVLDSGLGIVRIYQLILLPQTELSTPESRIKYDMKTIFRINPRSFGKYECFSTKFAAVEFEEICVANNTMTREDYLYCRELDLTIEIFHNTSLFAELVPVCRRFGISWFDFIMSIHDKIQLTNGKLKNIYQRFRVDCFANTFDTKESLIEYCEHNIDELLADSGGTNEIAKAKAYAVFETIEEMHDLAFSVLSSKVENKAGLNSRLIIYLEQLKKISLIRKSNLCNRKYNETIDLNYDFNMLDKNSYEIDPSKHFCAKKITHEIGYNSEEEQYVDAYFRQYGENIEGLGRILMRINMAQFIKPIRCIGHK